MCICNIHRQGYNQKYALLHLYTETYDIYMAIGCQTASKLAGI